MSASNDKNTPEVCTFAYFLESVPPGSKWAISDLFDCSFLEESLLSTPNTQLHCSTETMPRCKDL